MGDRRLDPDETTRELVLRYQNGEREALDRLFRRYVPALRRWAHGRLPAWARANEDTDDLVQETFLRVAQRMAEFRPSRPGGLRVYLRKTLGHRVVEKIRRAVRRPPERHSLPEQPAVGASAFEEVLDREMLEFYQAGLARLSEADRAAIVGRVETEMDYESLARALGKPSPEAARMAVARALVRLARQMHALAE